MGNLIYNTLVKEKEGDINLVVAYVANTKSSSVLPFSNQTLLVPNGKQTFLKGARHLLVCSTVSSFLIVCISSSLDRMQMSPSPHSYSPQWMVTVSLLLLGALTRESWRKGGLRNLAVDPP